MAGNVAGTNCLNEERQACLLPPYHSSSPFPPYAYSPASEPVGTFLSWTVRPRASRHDLDDRLFQHHTSEFPNFLLTPDANHLHIHRRPPHWRGVSRSSRTRGWMRWTLGGASDEGARSRMAKACGPDTSALVSSSRELVPAGDGGKKADHRGDHVISRKPLRAGMPG
jgi:hypothetical protein